MINNNLILDYLNDDNIAGNGAMNPVIKWIRNMATISEFLTISPNGGGSVDLDFDFAGVCARILKLVEKSYGEFRASISGKDRLTVQGGTIYMGKDYVFSLGSYSRNLGAGDDGKVLCANVTARGSVSWSWGSAPSALVTDTGVSLPVAKAVKSGNSWQAWQLHLGSFCFAIPPQCFIAGYDTTKTQSLDHVSGTLTWTTYKKCNK